MHQDVPGMIAHVTEILSTYNINIAQMNVTREKAGEKAIMIIEVDSRQCDEAVKEIETIPHLHNVNFFN
ncbi:D-3-phosphoglycerate dehydrogenase [Chlamydia trachomatis]|nr:D-3-phosphoglycerate dehydrogenase [Chlamydia trachomatis]